MSTTSIEGRIVAALSPIAPTYLAVKVDAMNDPEPETYFTFRVNTQGGCYADDDPTVEVALATAYLHAPLASNPNSIVRRAKAALHGAGFTWPEKHDASDDTERYIALEFADATGVDFDGEL